jgi:hypothetical protein
MACRVDRQCEKERIFDTARSISALPPCRLASEIGTKFKM